MMPRPVLLRPAAYAVDGATDDARAVDGAADDARAVGRRGDAGDANDGDGTGGADDGGGLPGGASLGDGEDGRGVARGTCRARRSSSRGSSWPSKRESSSRCRRQDGIGVGGAGARHLRASTRRFRAPAAAAPANWKNRRRLLVGAPGDSSALPDRAPPIAAANADRSARAPCASSRACCCSTVRAAAVGDRRAGW